MKPRKSFAAFIEGLYLLGEHYTDDGLNTTYGFGAEHDIIYIYVNPDKISEEDKEILNSLGFHMEDECVGYYT